MNLWAGIKQWVQGRKFGGEDVCDALEMCA